MNKETFINYLYENKDIIDLNDISLLVEGKVSQFVDLLNNKFNEEKNITKKYQIENLIMATVEFIEDYKQSSYKYCYGNCENYDQYKYWFNFYLENYLYFNAETVLKDVEKKFPHEIKKNTKLRNSYIKAKDYYEKTQKQYEKDSYIQEIENLIKDGYYNKALRYALTMIKEHPEDKRIQKLLVEIEKKKSIMPIMDSGAINSSILKLVGLEELMEVKNLSETDIKKIVDKLHQLLRVEEVDNAIILIEYLKKTYQISHPQISKIHQALVQKKQVIEKKKQQQEYDLEIITLKQYLKNKQLKDAEIKAHAIIKKYPLISKNEIYGIIKKIHLEQINILKNKNKVTFDDRFFDWQMKMASINNNAILNFYEKMTWFLKFHVNMNVILDTLYYQSKTISQKKLISIIKTGVESGLKISDILKIHSIVPVFDVTLIQIGEKTGTLSLIFENLYGIYQKSIERRKKIKSVMVYPSIVVGLTLIIFILLLIFIVPKFVSLFDQIGMKLPYITQKVLSLSDFVKTKWYLLLIFGIGSSVFSKFFFNKTYIGKYLFDLMLLKLPVVKDIVSKNNIVYFTQNLALLGGSGVLMIESLDLLTNGASNIFFQNELKRIKYEIEYGSTMSKAIGLLNKESYKNYQNKYIPIDVAFSIESGEKTGHLMEILNNVANIYEYELKMNIKNLETLIEPFIIIFVGGVVFIFVMSMFLPMLQMYNAIGQMSGVGSGGH